MFLLGGEFILEQASRECNAVPCLQMDCARANASPLARLKAGVRRSFRTTIPRVGHRAQRTTSASQGAAGAARTSRVGDSRPPGFHLKS